MSFMDSLASNPGGSSIYGMPGNGSGDIMGIVNNLKDREFNDFKNKAQFMSDLSIKQDRLRKLYGLDGGKDPNQQSQPQNTVMGFDPNQMTGYEKGELGIRQQAQNLDSQKVAQSGKMGEEALGIKSQQEQLNQQKSDQIHRQKIDDLTNKQSEYKQKMDMAYQQLQDKEASAEDQLKLHQSLADNTKAYHDAEMSKKDLAFAQAEQAHKDQIAMMQKKLDQANKPTNVNKIVVDAQGNKTTESTTTIKGNRIKVVGPNGETGTVDADEELPDGWSKQQ